MSKKELLDYLAGRVGRWRWVWWNGELVSLGEAMGRAADLVGNEQIIVSGEEIIVIRPGSQATEEVDLHLEEAS